MKILESRPVNDGFFMPAEYDRHYGCIMIWPERTDSWSFGGYEARKVFVKIASAIAESEKVIVCAGYSQYENARLALPDNIRVIEMSNNDAWARDCGPTFVVDSSRTLRGISWSFNAWGGLVDGLYFPWDKDDAMAYKLCDMLDADAYNAGDFVLEGGSIHVDGEGTAMVTASCLLSKGRNPSLTKAQIEQYLKDYLNVSKVLWLPCGVFNDETNEHVDNICAFTQPGHVVLGMTSDKDDVQYDMSMQCLDYLENETDAKGRPIIVHRLPMPSPVYITPDECEGLDSCGFAPVRTAGERLAASYVNFYISNASVVMPGFGNPDDPEDINHVHDAEAKKILEELFPSRRVIQIYTREILTGGGNIHCLTQQIPFFRLTGGTQ